MRRRRRKSSGFGDRFIWNLGRTLIRKSIRSIKQTYEEIKGGLPKEPEVSTAEENKVNGGMSQAVATIKKEESR